MKNVMPIEIVRTDLEPKALRTSPRVSVRFKFFITRNAMNWVALQMLTGDKAKYLGLIFTIAFSSFLIAQQVSIFAGIMNRTRSQILDVTDADVWVMDPATQYFDEVYPLKDSTAQRPRTENSVSRSCWEWTTLHLPAAPINKRCCWGRWKVCAIRMP